MPRARLPAPGRRDCCVSMFMARWQDFVLPHLPCFLEAYPDIEIYLSEGDRLVDLVREGIDCVLRVGTPQDSDMIARCVATLEEVTVASPGYVSRFGLPSDPDELHSGHRMIGFRTTGSSGILPLAFVQSGDMADRCSGT